MSLSYVFIALMLSASCNLSLECHLSLTVPISVYLSLQPMSLSYDVFSVIALMLSIMHAAQVTADAKSHWFMGVQLVVLYVLIATVYWFRCVCWSVNHAVSFPCI